MTGCLYFSPSGIPVVLSDCLVTSPNLVQHSAVPSNILAPGGILARSNAARLTRKIELFGTRTALAACGDESEIRKYLQEAASLLDPYVGQPTRQLATIASEKRKGFIGVIGSHVEDAIGPKTHHLLPDSSKKFLDDKLGTHFAIGSGSDALVKYVNKIGVNIARLSKKKWFHEYPYEMIRQVGEHICADVLNKESLGMPIIDDTWGGFVEYACFDLNLYKWIFGPSKIIFYFDCFITPSKSIYCHLSGRMLLYCSGSDFSQIYAVNNKHSGMIDGEWMLSSPLKCNISSISEYENLSFVERWSNWSPQSLTFTFNLFDPPSGRVRTAIFNNELRDINRVQVNFGSAQSYAKFDPDYMDELCVKACRHFGRRFSKASDLSRDDISYLKALGFKVI